MTYAEEVAALLDAVLPEGLGSLDGLDMVMNHASYVHHAEGSRVEPARCASGLMNRYYDGH